MGGVLRRTRGVAVLAVLAGTLAVAAPTTVGAEPAPGPQCDRFGVIGDSLTVQSQALYEQELQARGITQYRIDAQGGRRLSKRRGISSGPVAVKRMRAAGYQVGCFVVALGTNDVIASRRATDYEAWIRGMLDEIGPVPVLWIGPGMVPHLLETRNTLFNTVLADVATQYPNVTLVDWRPQIAEHPEWIRRDRVHLTTVGKSGRAAWLADLTLSVLFGTAPDPVPVDCTIAHTLRRGSSGPEVWCLEHRLEQLGYLVPGGADEVFDTATRTIVQDFQRWHRRYANGIVGFRTARLLDIWA